MKLFPDHYHLVAKFKTDDPEPCAIIDLPKPLEVPEGFVGPGEWTPGEKHFKSFLEERKLNDALITWGSRWESWFVAALMQIGTPPKLYNFMELVAKYIRAEERFEHPDWQKIQAKIADVGFGGDISASGHDPYELCNCAKVCVAERKRKLFPEADATLDASCRYVADRKIAPLHGVFHEKQYVTDFEMIDKLWQKEWTAISESPWDVFRHLEGTLTMINAWIPQSETRHHLPALTAKHFDEARKKMTKRSATG